MDSSDEIIAFNVDRVIEQQDIMLENHIKRYVQSQINQSPNKSKLCYDCEDEIDEKRLKILPEAKRCVECATILEKRTTFKKGLDSVRSIIENMNT